MENFKEMAADWLAAKISGRTLKDLELKGNPIRQEAIDRSTGFNKVLSSQIVKSEVANFNRAEAKTAVKNSLANNLDFNVIYAHNDEIIFGAITATKDDGKKFRESIFIRFH